ncbi:MAG: class I SAM-dependent methyltransferase [Candidatus Diapherotrites archaeon]|nr:class I SAM-dependent methyltransferase [Candidatus Diapherotrites archaeon]
MPARTRSATKKFLKRYRGWFGRGNYNGTQSFYTFSQPIANRRMIQEHIKSLVSDPKAAHALEIGPGTTPTLPLTGFRQIHFMDADPRILQQLRNAPVKITLKEPDAPRNARTTFTRPLFEFANQRAHFLVGDLRELPFSNKKPFDLIVVNEVLTHIRPIQRMRIISSLADRTKALVILDRTHIPIAEMLSRFKEAARVNRRWADIVPKQAAKWREIADAQERLTTHDARQEQQRRIRFDLLARTLARKGWMVETIPLEDHNESYILLKARKQG